MGLATRRLDEMTSREVEFYLKAGGDLIFIPFGPVSGHGALLPMGIHCHWAHALSSILAEKADGLVFPPSFICYAGATQTFRGTVSFPVEQQVAILVHIARTLQCQGFRRTVLVGGTTPESTGGAVAARKAFDETGRPVWFVEAARLLDHPQIRSLYQGYPGNFGETVIGLASLKALGRQRPIPLAGWARELKTDGEGDQPAEVFDTVVSLRRWGSIGFRYYEEKNHGNHGTAGIRFKERLDVDLAVEVLEKCADVLLPDIQALSSYCDWVANHPFRYITATDRLDEK
jgi:hypothetical protein